VCRDFANQDRFSELLSDCGIANDDTVFQGLRQRHRAEAVQVLAIDRVT
jgi:3-mercaptopyruvate sulfurtransferase SseA